MIDRIVVWALRLRSERGQDLIEYAMLGGLIALAIIAVGVLGFSGALNDMFTGIGTASTSTPVQPCISFGGVPLEGRGSSPAPPHPIRNKPGLFRRLARERAGADAD